MDAAERWDDREYTRDELGRFSDAGGAAASAAEHAEVARVAAIGSASAAAKSRARKADERASLARVAAEHGDVQGAARHALAAEDHAAAAVKHSGLSEWIVRQRVGALRGVAEARTSREKADAHMHAARTFGITEAEGRRHLAEARLRAEAAKADEAARARDEEEAGHGMRIGVGARVREASVEPESHEVHTIQEPSRQMRIGVTPIGGSDEPTSAPVAAPERPRAVRDRDVPVREGDRRTELPMPTAPAPRSARPSSSIAGVRAAQLISLPAPRERGHLLYDKFVGRNEYVGRRDSVDFARWWLEERYLLDLSGASDASVLAGAARVLGVRRQDSRGALLVEIAVAATRRDAADWDETAHPRDELGRFGEGGGHAERAYAHADEARSLAKGTTPAARASARKAEQAARDAHLAAAGGDHAAAAKHAANAEKHLASVREKTSGAPRKTNAPAALQTKAVREKRAEDQLPARSSSYQGARPISTGSLIPRLHLEVKERQFISALPFDQQVKRAHGARELSEKTTVAQIPPEQQRATRDALDAVAAAAGLPKQEVHSINLEYERQIRVHSSDEMGGLATATRQGSGRILLSNDEAERLAKFSEHEDPRELGRQIASLPEGGSRRADLAGQVIAYSTVVHETVHGHGPQLYYQGPGLAVEEIATEMVAKRLALDAVGLTRQQMPEIMSQGYPSAIRQLASHVSEASGVNDHHQVLDAIERASFKLKSQSGAPDFSKSRKELSKGVVSQFASCFDVRALVGRDLKDSEIERIQKKIASGLEKVRI